MRISDVRTGLANTSFYLLFPGFFFYNFAIARDIMPPVLGGYFGVVAAALFAPLLMLNAKVSLRNIQLPSLLFFIILFLIIFISIVQYSLGSPENFSIEMFAWNMKGLLFNVVCFMVAASMTINGSFRMLCLLSLLMYLVVVFNVGNQGIFHLKQEAGMAMDSVSTYQGLARSLVVVLLLTTALCFRRYSMGYFLVFFGIVALFLNGARTEFAFYMLSLIVFFLFYSITSLKTVLVLCGLLLISVFLTVIAAEMLPQSRMFQLTDITSSSSFQSRQEMFWYGVEQVIENPIFGNYGSYTAIGGIGSYPHNLLSAWVNLGLVGFVLYFFMLALLWVEALKSFGKHRNIQLFKVFFIFLIFVTFALIASKTYSYMLIGMTLGFYVAYRKFCLRINL